MDEMNVQLIAAEIVSRVHRSPDSAHNLAQVVAGLIEQEMERDKLVAKDGYIRLDEWDRLRLEREFRRDFGSK